MKSESYLDEAITVLAWATKLMVKKGADYQGGSVCDDDYYPHGWKSFDTMLTTKVLRFRSVMEQNGEVNFDSAEDCLIDLINYSARCVVFLNRQRAKVDSMFSEHMETGKEIREEEELPYNGA